MQNKGAEVSIAIPKAKKPVKYERVSPGVYRGSNGDLKRSASNPTKSPGLTSGMNPGERFLPGRPLDLGDAGSAAGRAAGNWLEKQPARPTRKPGLGTGAEMTIQPFLGTDGSLKDVFDRMKKEPAGPMPANTDALMKSLRDMLGGMGDGRDRRDMFNPLLGAGNMRPAPRPNMINMEIDPGYAVDPGLFDGSLYERARAAATPQIPRSGGSVADLLRRR